MTARQGRQPSIPCDSLFAPSRIAETCQKGRESGGLGHSGYAGCAAGAPIRLTSPTPKCRHYSCIDPSAHARRLIRGVGENARAAVAASDPREIHESSTVPDQLELSPPAFAVSSEGPAAVCLEKRENGWPRRCDLFGVRVSATTYEEVCDAIVDAVRAAQPAVVSFYAVHAIVTASMDRDLLRKVNDFDVIAPDGQPVRGALNRLYDAGLPDRVCGPELMLRLCQRAALEAIPIYLYGSSPAVIEALSENLTQKYPGLIIAGAESPPFRKLSAEEDEEMVRRINESGAGIVFIGLGCPKQDHFAADHRDRIRAVQCCVGAAFDFHAGVKKPAPVWMQRRGLEWAYRLIQEPRRLWRRYLVTNTLFIQKFVVQWGSMWLRGIPSTTQNQA